MARAVTETDHRATTAAGARGPALAKGAQRCRRKFLRFFPHGYHDETYIDWERDYKQEAHERWVAQLGRDTHQKLITAGQFEEIASRAVKIESRTNLLFSFEKMALRDAVRSPGGAELFARGLYGWLWGSGSEQERFEEWIGAVSELPRRQTRVLTWPLVTVFGFLARPDTHVFLKPNVTRVAAREYGVEFAYDSRPTWETYASLLAFAQTVWKDTKDLRPRDMIDIQSFIWVQGSDEYEE